MFDANLFDRHLHYAAPFLDTVHPLVSAESRNVLQFSFFNRSEFQNCHEFPDRLVPFLKKLPPEYKSQLRFRIEIGWTQN